MNDDIENKEYKDAERRLKVMFVVFFLIGLAGGALIASGVVIFWRLFSLVP